MRFNRKRVAALLTGVGAFAIVPEVAWATDGSGVSSSLIGVIQSLGVSVNDLIVAGALVVASTVSGFALVSILMEILPLLFARERPEFTKHIQNCLKVIAVCVLAGVSLLIVNGAVNFITGGLFLGDITGASSGA